MSTPTIMGLSLWQPWASLMAIGAKKIETRSWATNYRGLVAIHAAKKWDLDLREYSLIPEVWAHLSQQYGNPNSLHRGCFVALGRLHRCLSTGKYTEAIPDEDSDEFSFGDYSEGRFMWVFDEIWQLKAPVYAIGHQSLWKLSEAEAEVVLTFLPDGVEDQLLAEVAK